MRLREVEFLRQPTKIQFGRSTASAKSLNRCYVVSLQGERGSDSDRQYDTGRGRYIYKVKNSFVIL